MRTKALLAPVVVAVALVVAGGGVPHLSKNEPPPLVPFVIAVSTEWSNDTPHYWEFVTRAWSDGGIECYFVSGSEGTFPMGHYEGPLVPEGRIVKVSTDRHSSSCNGSRFNVWLHYHDGSVFHNFFRFRLCASFPGWQAEWVRYGQWE